MKVILSAKSVFPFHPVGGVQKYVYYFAKHLAQKGIEVEVVAPLDGGRPRTEVYDGIRYTLLRPAIYRYLEYPIGWLGVHLFSRSLNRYLQKQSFDILHSFDLTGYQYVNTKHRKPVIAHIFTDNYLSNPIAADNPLNFLNFTGSQHDRIKAKKITISPFADKATRRKYLLQYAFKIKPMHRCLQQADAVFFEANDFRDEVNDLYRLDPGKSSVIPVGTDISFIQEVIGHTHVSREELGFRKEDIVLITVNRLAADKGVDKTLLALDKIIKEDPRVKLIIVGSGYQEREIHDLIKQKSLTGHVRHVKNVLEGNLYRYYSMADIYISAFSYPGSSISTLEAMACSLPVITTGQPWLINEGRNGIALVDNDFESIADAVLELIRQKRLKQQGAVSREIVRDYDWDTIAQKAVQQYGQILAGETISYETH